MSEANTHEEYVIGRYYRVPSVLVAEWRGFKGWLPVIGERHEDAELVGFPWQHFHIDWRFAPEKLWTPWHNFPRPGAHYGRPIQCPDSRGVQVVLEGPTPRRMKYKRELVPYPTHAATWLPRMRERYACAKLVAGKCPHRGIPVSAMRRDGDILECPGHGLRWNAITGELAV